MPLAQCCEMEGAAVAQACLELGLKFVVVRVVSDCSEESAGIDFDQFCDQVAGFVTCGILQAVIQQVK